MPAGGSVFSYYMDLSMGVNVEEGENIVGITAQLTYNRNRKNTIPGNKQPLPEENLFWKFYLFSFN